MGGHSVQRRSKQEKKGLTLSNSAEETDFLLQNIRKGTERIAREYSKFRTKFWLVMRFSPVMKMKLAPRKKKRMKIWMNLARTLKIWSRTKRLQHSSRGNVRRLRERNFRKL